MTWWETLPNNQSVHVLLLQVDLSGHTKWLEGHPYTVVACHDRAGFANQLRHALAFEQFDLLFWAGDGGVFAKRLDLVQCRGVGQAMDKVFDTFEDFHRKYPVLSIRVVATYLTDLIIYKDSGYWCSQALNDFLKFERHLAIDGGATITETLHKQLCDEQDVRRFSIRRIARIGNSASSTFVDCNHTGSLRHVDKGFQQWLEEALATNQLPKGRKNPGGRIEIGQCTILDAARRPDGIPEVIAIPREPLTEETAEAAVLPEHRQQWRGFVAQLKRDQVQGWSTSVFGYRGDISEDPFRFYFRPVPYVYARGFHSLLQNDVKLRGSYREIALAVEEDRATLLNILSVGVAVMIGQGEEKFLVLAQRNIQREGGYEGGLWSPTVGEQFSPFAHDRGRMQLMYPVAQDSTVSDCAIRALKEELVGNDFSGRMNISIAAFAMENHLYNFVFFVVADLRPMSFDTLKELWPKARDANEHRALALLDIHDVKTCLTHEALPDALWKKLFDTNRVYPGTDIPPESRRLQANAHARLATYLWFAGE